MPRPLLKQNDKLAQKTNDLFDINYKKEEVQETKQIDKVKLDRMLKKKRSKQYLEALRKLDAGGHVRNKEKVDEIIDKLLEEFPEVSLKGILIGYVAPCYLGNPYEVHVLDLDGHIVEHYQKGEPLPDGLEKARSIAIRGNYEFIEVYEDCCRAISSDGTVGLIPN